MGFSEAEEDTPTQEIVISPQQLKGDAAPIQLRFAKFQNVTSLTVRKTLFPFVPLFILFSLLIWCYIYDATESVYGMEWVKVGLRN